MPQPSPAPASHSRSHVFRLITAVSLLGIGVTAIAGGCGSEAGSGDPGASSSGTSGDDGTSGGTSGDFGTSGGTSGASGGTSGSSGGTSGSSGGTSGSSGTSSGELPDVQFIYDPPPRDASLTSDSACAQASATATLQPLDMFVMMDRSISMQTGGSGGGDCNVSANGVPSNQSRWCRSINALATYFKSSASTGNAAALEFFGNNNDCNASTYDQSSNPGGTTGYLNLPSTSFDATLNNASPNGYTPLAGAVRGLIAFTARPQNRRTGRQTIGVLITDADTSTLQCQGQQTINNHIAALAAELDQHFKATGVRTYVVGMEGASFSHLETLAVGGNAPSHPDNVGNVTDACGNGNGPCRHWNVGNGTNNALAEAMKLIQGSAIGCTYQMPTTDAGIINPENVSVEYEQNGAPPALQLQRVPNAGACVANGWYYDNNANPSTITLCPAQCTTVQADPIAEVRVLLGCLGG